MLQWMHSRLLELDHKLDAEARAAVPAGTPAPAVIKQVFTDASRPDCAGYKHALVEFTAADEVRLLLEAFYYSAHRIRDILQDGREDLRGVGKFEAVGVRNARNHLIEHPGGPNGVLVFSIATGGPVGPQLKPLRWSLDQPGTMDDGLQKNASEFEAALNTVLKKAISACAV